MFYDISDIENAPIEDKERIEKLKEEFILGQKGLCTKVNNELDGEPEYVINRFIL
ncbi:hypothetical protein [Commensalibacter nepenthis]|uniref:Uncharacterized protein n=1 Tax=Commensalibacter nepenthis TaxID=3043872 RepID=A0ABT6Q4B1_9PROT|nr:hypothetical protein [Commensalibacter sp. TBRC 10068]MDI2111724.1 hypothetical protein [Commensalibacter sp. TBRC 10068]